MRSGLNKELGFSEADRFENIRRTAEVAKLFKETGVVTIVCAITPIRELRSLAKDIIGREDFLEIYVNSSVEECERRDTKGLYAKARSGEVKDFTGIVHLLMNLEIHF
jgi:adenylylsulfate kinase